MAPSKVSDLNSLYNNIYEDSLVTLREENVLVANGMVTIFQGEGFADRKVPTWNSASVATVPEGTDYVGGTAFAKSNLATFSPEVRMAQFLLTDQMISTDSQENVIEKASTELGAAIAEQVDEDLVDDFLLFTQSKGSANTTLTLGMIGAAIALLRANKVRGERTVCLHPYGWHDIWTLLGQPAATYDFLGDTATEALRRYFVSNLQGATWITHGSIDIDDQTDAVGAVFTKEALAYDGRVPFKIETERDSSAWLTEYNASIAYDHGILRAVAGVKIIHDATEPTV